MAEVGPVELDVPDASGMFESRHAPETAGVGVLDHRGYPLTSALMEDRDPEPGRLITPPGPCGCLFPTVPQGLLGARSIAREVDPQVDREPC